MQIICNAILIFVSHSEAFASTRSRWQADRIQSQFILIKLQKHSNFIRFVRNGFASIHNCSLTFCKVFVRENFHEFLQMSYNHCKCLAINKNGFRLLMIFWRKQEEYTFLANIRSMFLIFVTPQKVGECLRTLTNIWRLRYDDYELVENGILGSFASAFGLV